MKLRDMETPMVIGQDRCFACGRKLKEGRLANTLDAQIVNVGPECFKRIANAGEQGYQGPLGGPKLYPYTQSTI